MIVGRDDLDGFDGERLFRVLREHRNKDVVAYFGFRFVGCCYVDEDIAGLKRDFAMIGIDDWRHRTDCAIRIKYDRVYRRLSYYMQIA